LICRPVTSLLYQLWEIDEYRVVGELELAWKTEDLGEKTCPIATMFTTDPTLLYMG
jgi:hypothetical protein